MPGRRSEVGSLLGSLLRLVLVSRCKGGQDFSVWVEGEKEVAVEFIGLGCRAQPRDSDEVVSTCGAQGEGTEVNIGFDIRSEVGGVETVTITVCYDTARSINIWSRHSLWDEIDARDHGNDSPSFSPDQYFDFDVNHFYTMVRGGRGWRLLLAAELCVLGPTEEDHSGDSEEPGLG